MTKKRLINIVLIVVVLGIAIGIGYYYYSHFDRSDDSKSHLLTEVPQDHPEIYPDESGAFPAEGEYCLKCHGGIMPARPFNSGMMQEIFAKGAELGDPNGCVVCHGGTPSETVSKEHAHSGVPEGSRLMAFTPVPASLQVNENTCGLCHAEHVYNAHRSHMNTDAGKMKTIEWSYGLHTDDHRHRYGDHAVEDPDGMTPTVGTEQYKAYMRAMAEQFPDQFPSALKQVPEVSLEDIKQEPGMAAYTLLSNCNACHLSNKGMQDRGHFRGMGCAACHSLYNNEGMYEGGDPSISKTEPGHLMVHGMLGSRKSAVAIHGTALSGLQVSTCAACHTAGRRIGFAYQGLMALGHGDHRGPFDEKGREQQPNAGYVYKYIRDDLHHRIAKDGKEVTGLLCQDCHLTTAMHGNGNIGATTLATVEIECADCHGTPTHYPWELPLGYGEEFGRTLRMSEARGLAEEPMEITKRFGTIYPKEDGYLLSSRGNPMGNVVRRGNKVIVHSETGYDFIAPTLKELTEKEAWKSPTQAKTAMVAVAAHMDKLECYACHSTWAPQYYGYKAVMDYSRTSVDWLKSSDTYAMDGTTPDYHGQYAMQPGAHTNWDYSHTRWETPPLGVNGEGRVSPLTGVIQTVSTVLDGEGNTLEWNQVHASAAGHAAPELAPLQPHTASREARDCVDCHGNSLAQGYGIHDNAYDSSPETKRFADVVDANAQNVSRFTRTQIEAIKGLHSDFMAILDPETGKQLLTVDSHWSGSMPLTADQRAVLSRDGVCAACHIDIPEGSIPIQMLGKIAEVADLSFTTPEAHDRLLWENNTMISWIKMLGILAIVILIPLLILLWIVRHQVASWLRRVLEPWDRG